MQLSDLIAEKPELMFRLPLSPPVNNLYFNLPRRGRVKTVRYRNWIAEADKWYALQHLHERPKITGCYSAVILLPKVRGDIDGRAKSILDWCVTRNITDDDKNLTKLEISVDPEIEKGDCWIILRRVAA